MPLQITGNSNVCSSACSGLHHMRQQSSTALALCQGHSPVTGGFTSQSASNEESVSMSWHLHENIHVSRRLLTQVNMIHIMGGRSWNWKSIHQTKWWYLVTIITRALVTLVYFHTRKTSKIWLTLSPDLARSYGPDPEYHFKSYFFKYY